MGSWCCRFAATARRPCRRPANPRAIPGCPVDPGAGSGASPASRAAPGASPAARRRPGRKTRSSPRSRTTARRGRPGATTLESQRCRRCPSRVPVGARRTAQPRAFCGRSPRRNKTRRRGRGSSVPRRRRAASIAPHRMVLRLRSLVARGRAKLPRARRRSQASASSRALYFIVRQGDNGIVWKILSYWRATK